LKKEETSSFSLEENKKISLSSKEEKKIKEISSKEQKDLEEGGDLLLLGERDLLRVLTPSPPSRIR
jgi:hypothetical protein